jgi:hypothetical protein
LSSLMLNSTPTSLWTSFSPARAKKCLNLYLENQNVCPIFIWLQRKFHNTNSPHWILLSQATVHSIQMGAQKSYENC